MPGKFRTALLFAAMSTAAFAAGTLDHASDTQARHPADAQAGDARISVAFPETLRVHTLANMRDHLLALQQIQDALAADQYARAGDLAEERLGMSSLKSHGAHEAAPHMPPGMRAIGSAMHRSASRFALAAHEAAAGGELKPALAALARVTEQCVACHAAYRIH